MVVAIEDARDAERRCGEGGPVASQESRVLIVDDDPEFRAFVATTLANAGFATVEAGSAEGALERVAEETPRLAILDICLPTISGYELGSRLRDAFGPGLPNIFVSGERVDPLDRVTGLLLGGDDYLTKPFEPGELLIRVRRCLAAVEERPQTAPTRALGLTPREQEVLALLAQGLTQGAIASRLDISSKTVGIHLEHVLEKLEVHSRAQAVSFAFRERLVEPEPVASRRRVALEASPGSAARGIGCFSRGGKRSCG
jgi:DNA-binding NarL/FixJ family response regulator